MDDLDCPGRPELQAYADGRLDDETSERLASHVEACADCQRELQMLDSHSDSAAGGLRRARMPPIRNDADYQRTLDQTRAAVDHGLAGQTPSVLGATCTSPELRPLGEYQLLEKLGEGGMGAVYKALQVKLEKTVALKVLPPDRVRDPRAVARFEREMKAIGRLAHPNIVQAHDARDIEGTSVLVMEYVDGCDLAVVVHRLGPLRIADACELVRQAAAGLQCAHEHGLVHRDIKPSNLMLSRSGQVKVLDLGLALLQSGQAGDEMTGSGQAMGTADYIAPEQVLDSHGVDIRADIYSLGCTLYKLLTGRAPFSGPERQSAFAKMMAHVQQSVRPVQELRPDLPAGLTAVVGRMVARQPDQRFATPAEVAQSLEPFCRGADVARLHADATGASRPRPAPTRSSVRSSVATGEDRLPGVGETQTEQLSPARALTGTRRVALRLVAVALGLISLIVLGIVFYLRDGRQTVKVEIDPALVQDASVTVWLDGRELEVAGVGETIRLQPGPHGYEIRRGDQVIRAQEFTVVKGDNPALKVRVETAPVAGGPGPPTDAAAAAGSTAPPSPADEDDELVFDGVRSYVKTPVKYDGSHPLTLEAYVTLGDVWAYHVVFSNRDLGQGMSLEIDPARRWRVVLLQGEDKQAHLVSRRPAPAARHHVALVFESGQPTLFLNGVREEIGQFSNQEPYRPSSEPFAIGAHQVAATWPTATFCGSVDEVRISRVARYRDDFVPERRLEPDEQTLALYHFNDGRGATARDASANSNHARIEDALWRPVGAPEPLPGLIAQPAQIPGVGRWQVATRAPLAPATALAWSPNGEHLACASLDGWVRLYDAHSLTPRTLLPGNRGGTNCAAWSRDGTWLATGGGDGTVRLWKADGAGGPVCRTRGAVLAIAWSPDSRQIVLGGYGRCPRFFSTDGAVRSAAVSCVATIRHFAWSPDGARVASADDSGAVRLWEASGETGPILEASGKRMRSVCWSPDGQQLATGGADGIIRLWGTDGTERAELKGHGGRISALAWSDDGRRLASAASDDTVRIWRLDAKPAQVVIKFSAPTAVAWSPDGRSLACATYFAGFCLWDCDGNPGPSVPGVWTHIDSISASPTSGELALSNGSRALIWDANGRPLRTLPATTGATSVAWSPTGACLAVGHFDGEIDLWTGEDASGQVLRGHQARVSSLAWSPDGQQLASASEDRTLRLWRADGGVLATLDGHQSPLRAVAWSPDGTQLASWDAGSCLRFWQRDGTPGRVVQSDDQPSGGGSVGWRPDGKWLACAKSQVQLWQPDGTAGVVLGRTMDGTPQAAWSPDGRWLAAGGCDASVRVWHADGQPLSTLWGQRGPLCSIAWMGDSRHLVSGDLGGMVRMWNIEDGSTAWTAICLRDGRSITFSPTGEIVYGHPKVVEEELVYLVEQPGGALKMLAPSQFRQLAGR